MNSYHITWIKPSMELNGIVLDGKTYSANSFSEALKFFEQEYPEIGEPLYIIKQVNEVYSTEK